MKTAPVFFRGTAFLSAIFFPLAIFAGPVGEVSARQKAVAFMQQRRGDKVSLSVPRSQRRAPSAGSVDGYSPYYVFNVGSGEGFVIVSGDDRTPDILGYADSGTLSESDMPDGLRYLLDGYAEQLEWLEAQPSLSAQSSFKAPARSAIAPLLSTQWDQVAPYNNLCPKIGDELTVTGCVATSMAQLMYYHQHPASSPAIPSYSYTAKDADRKTFSKTVEGLSGTNFLWGDMTLAYDDDATGPAADAVATLMRYCGQSINMSYGLRVNGGSSSYGEAIPSALTTYFGYDGGVRSTYRSSYSYPEWVDLLYGELAARRPVILGGQSVGGGHSFVCDGYQGDDYFHINWGWSGDGDGYFRLSALNPYVQGAGGSSTLDGFSYDQQAVIGIQPPVSGTPSYCLSLEGLRLGAPDDKEVSKTYTRNAETHDFQDISLYFLVYNYHQGSQSFDYAVQLTAADGTVRHTFYTKEGETMTWNVYNKGDDNTKGRTLKNLSIPSTLIDGTYYIKVVSRPTGSSEWQECFDGDRYQLTATVGGDLLTILVPIPSTCLPEQATLSIDETVEGSLTQGYDQQVTATITGGEADYHNDVILRVNGTAVMGKTLDIPAHQTVDAHFTYIPSTTGANVLTLHTARTGGSQIGDTPLTVTIKESDATDQIDNLAFDATIDNQDSDGHLYGGALRATITVRNPSTAATYVGRLNCSLRKWVISYTDNADGSQTRNAAWESMGYASYPLKVDKNGGTTTLQFASDALAPTDDNTRYSLRITYRNSAAEGKVKDGVHLGLDADGVGVLTVTGGYCLGSSDGTTTLHKPAATIDAGDACFVDMTTLGSTDGVSVTPSTNPNCLYLLAADAAVPQGLSGKNVVKGATAETVALTDGYDFFSPIDFTAATISYTRTFSRAATTTGGWNGLFLPFDVSAVTCGNSEIDWFRSDSDTGKHFWLKTMTGDADGTVYFDHATALKANTPYIIALPGADFGQWQLTGKPITFAGTDATVTATATAALTGALNGNSYKFRGSTVGSSLSDAYLLNSNGNRFILGAIALPPFRSWIEAVSISSLSRQQLAIGDGATGIADLTADGDTQKGGAETLYTLDGRKVANPTKGLYITNGKKIIVK